MKRLAILVLAACSVPAKQAPSDGGPTGDAPPDSPTGELDTTITNAPAVFSPTNNAVFEFTSNVAGATFTCSIDGEVPAPCTSPLSRTLGDGSHAFSVRAMATDGRSDSTPAEHLWTIDTIAPDTTLTQVPPVSDNSVTVQFMFISNEDNVTFECSVDSTDFLACASGDSFGPFGDGPHTFAVRARDRAGNVDASPAIRAWSIDTSTPDTQIVSGPNGPTASTSATFTFISPDAGGGSTFECSLDSAAFVACTSPFAATNLAERQHTFAVRVRDAVGNVDPTPATHTWTVDLTPPDTQIVSGPTGTVTMASASFTFTATETGVKFECNLDSAGFAACTSPVNTAMLAQGGHTFAVRATDAAGNTDASPATRTWVVDTTAPDIMITSGPAEGSTSGPRVTFTFTASDGTIACSLDGAPFAPCASPFAFNAPAGRHQFQVRATDAAGNTAVATRTWTVACAAPDAAGAAALLHLDDGSGQTAANAVAGGAAGILGTDMTVEAADPAWLASARFGGALAFTASEGDHVTWPAALGPTSAFTVEMWLQPDAAAGARVIFATGDSRFAVTSTAVSPTTVQISASIVGSDSQGHAITSGVVAAGTWHHVLVSFSEPSLRLWVDGVRVERDDVALGSALAFDSLAIGGTFSGALDEIWVAQTPITADEAALGRYCPIQ